MLLTVLALLSAQTESLCDDEEQCRTECNAGILAQCQALADTIVPDEPVEAIKLYEKACGKGLIHSCAKLAFHLVEHRSANRAGRARAMKLTEQACNANDALGCSNLATWLWDLWPASFVRAAAAAEKGCRLEDLFACGTLGTMYKDGIGVERECDNEYAAACFQLSGANRRALGVRRDRQKARELLSRACELGMPQACPGDDSEVEPTETDEAP